MTSVMKDFLVSSGRCTRGAFLQLLPVDNLANNLCDYVLIVDTDGLRAPQLALEQEQAYKRDHAFSGVATPGLTRA